jgi:hypothetical protein
VLAQDKSDVTGCKTRIKALDPITVANKDARTACIAQSQKAAPNPKFCDDFAQQDTPACPDGSRAALTGTKKINDPCNTASECAPDFTGIVDCQSGVCQLRKRGIEGSTPCDRTIDGDVTLSLPQPADGANVFNCFLVEDGLQCDPQSKKCVKPLADRATCNDDGECANTQFCDTTEKKCFNKLAKDNVCDEDAECNGHCDNPDPDNKAGKCIDKVNENDQCETVQWCTEGLDCVSGKCTKPGPDTRLAATCTGKQ